MLIVHSLKIRKKKKQEKRGEKPFPPYYSANLYLKRMTVKLFQKKKMTAEGDTFDFENRKRRAREFLLW